MEERLKRRLVGAIVLVSLAIIFIPMMLDGRRSEQQLVSGIPDRDTGPYNEQLPQAKPEAPIVPIKPVPVEETAQVAAPAPEPVTPAPAEVAPVPPAPKPVPAAAAPKTLTAWVVQVGSFSKHEGADSIAGKLRAAGFDTSIEKAQVNGLTVYRVQVGPEADKARAEALRDSIRSKLKLDGKVMTYPSS